MENSQNLKINKTQKKFLNSALSLYNHVIDFDIDDKEFLEFFGVSKSIMMKEIENISKNIDKLSF